MQIMQQKLCNGLINEKWLLKTGNDQKICDSHDNLRYYEALPKKESIMKFTIVN